MLARKSSSATGHDGVGDSGVLVMPYHLLLPWGWRLAGTGAERHGRAPCASPPHGPRVCGVHLIQPSHAPTSSANGSWSGR